MKLKDITNGSDWMIWVMFAVFVLIIILLLTGHGANLIVDYNKASPQKKEKYNEKSCVELWEWAKICFPLLWRMSSGRLFCLTALG